MKVLITDNNLGDSQIEQEILKAGLGAEVKIAQCTSEEQVISALKDFPADAMIVQWAPVTARVLEAASNCRVISRMGIGIDMIDVDFAESRDVKVMNVPHYCTEEVAVHAISLILALNRRLFELDGHLRDGRWNAAEFAPSIKKISASTVALIGLGRIGTIVADCFTQLGASVIAVDPVQKKNGIRSVTVEDVAEQADIISVHAPLVETTHHLLDQKFFSACKKRPIVVNTSRGAIINTTDLAHALEEEQVAAAGIDVFEREPLEADHPLRSAPRALLTPHAAWCSAEALPELRRQTAQNVLDFFGELA